MRKRDKAILKSNLERSLLVYAGAAGAAGAGVLALASPADARIVYTPADAKIGNGISIDPNHDGTVDFTLQILSGENGSSADFALVAYSSVAHQNGVVATPEGPFARALPSGAQIGPKRQFTEDEAVLFDELIKFGNSNTRFTYWTGPWAKGGQGVRNRYLGLKFKINGKDHFGWAKISTAPPFSGDVLKGYAYETKANKPIVAGDKGTGASLGHLALGAHRLSAWRRPVATEK